MDITSLKIINEVESYRSPHKEESNYVELPNVESTNALIDEKNKDKNKVITN